VRRAYILIEGSVSVRIETNYGTINLSTVSAPTLVGEIGLLPGVPRTATIQAAVPLRALRIEGVDLQKFRQRPHMLPSSE
jgi:CRP-like cAMP-binding protein